VIHTNISLDRLLQEALVATDRRAADLDAGGEVGGEDEDEWEDEVDLESRPPTPLSDISSPLSSPPSSPSASHPPTPTPSSPSVPRLPTPTPSPIPMASSRAPTASAGNIEKQRKKDRAATRRHARRQQKASAAPYARVPKPRGQGYREQSPHTADLDASELPRSSGGAWVGRRSKGTRRRYFTLPELDEMGCAYIEWNGRYVFPIPPAFFTPRSSSHMLIWPQRPKAYCRFRGAYHRYPPRAARRPGLGECGQGGSKSAQARALQREAGWGMVPRVFTSSRDVLQHNGRCFLRWRPEGAYSSCVALFNS
jgi:hypothetical protein